MVFQAFEVEQIFLEMGDSKRPEEISVLKSADGITFTPWAYRVTDENECTETYEVPVSPTPRDLDSAICQSYALSTADSKFEQVGYQYYFTSSFELVLILS